MIQSYPPTFILRHRRENLKKCSLRGLEARSDMHFLTYPTSLLPRELDNYVLLTLDAPLLTSADMRKGLFILDGTWRYAEKMLKFVEGQLNLERRSIPEGFRTAYPRRQEDCPDPEVGLASIEALFIAYFLLGYNTAGLLDCYYWKDAFLENNKLLLYP